MKKRAGAMGVHTEDLKTQKWPIWVMRRAWLPTTLVLAQRGRVPHLLPAPLRKGGEIVQRIIVLLTLVLVIAALMALNVDSAFAVGGKPTTPPNPSALQGCGHGAHGPPFCTT